MCARAYAHIAYIHVPTCTHTRPPERHVRRCLRVCITRVYTRGCTRARGTECLGCLSKENAGPSFAATRKRETGSVTSCRSAVIRDITPFVQHESRSVQRTQRGEVVLRSLVLPCPHFYLSHPLSLPPLPARVPISNHRPFLPFLETLARSGFQAAETCHLLKRMFETRDYFTGRGMCRRQPQLLSTIDNT